jgi:hypothetical protein
VRARAGEKIREVDDKMRDPKRIRSALVALVDACADRYGGGMPGGGPALACWRGAGWSSTGSVTECIPWGVFVYVSDSDVWYERAVTVAVLGVVGVVVGQNS